MRQKPLVGRTVAHVMDPDRALCFCFFLAVSSGLSRGNRLSVHPELRIHTAESTFVQ